MFSDTPSLKTDTKHFLEMLLWLNEGQENGDRIDGATVYEFTPQFVKGVDGFISGFRAFLESKGFDMDRLDHLERSFDGNCLASLSGHGIGFFDEYGDPEKTLGGELQKLIEEYSGNRHRFEGLESSIMRRRKISLALRRPFIAEGIRKLFTVPSNQ